MALLMLLFIVAMSTIAMVFHGMNNSSLQTRREQETALALSNAKQALLAYAFSVNLKTSCFSSSNCAKPGELPCPDTDNDGAAGSSASTSCGNASGSTGQSLRIGRLPWKTLGMGELRDGYGETLWYAVSSRYKNSTHYIPLNSDTTGTISLRDSEGNIINDATSASGVVAVVFSAGPPITRQDGTVQSRSSSSDQNNSLNYLDNALGEDNASFVDSSSDGFILGPVKDGEGNEILNDRLLVITRDEMIPVMENRVLAEVANALLFYYCGNHSDSDVNYSTRTCVGAGTKFPHPAAFWNTNCLGTGSSSCSSNSSTDHGRIPAAPDSGDWNSSSILRGSNSGNWFQQNGWRELVHYAAAPACLTGANCTGGGSGFLTLDHTPGSTATAKAVVIAAGRTLSLQSRASSFDKMFEMNYLEGENLLPLDDVYTWVLPTTSTMNDRAVFLP